MKEELRKALEALGLKEGATDEEAVEFITSLKGKKAEEFEALLKKQEEFQGQVDKLNELVAAAQSAGDDENKKKDIETVKEEAAKEAVQLERERSDKIHKLAEQHKLPPAWAQKMVATGRTFKQVEDLIALKADMEPIQIAHVGENLGKSGLADAITDAILLRANRPLIDIDEDNVAKRDEKGALVLRQPAERARSFRHASLSGMARAWLTELSVPAVESMPVSQVVRLVMSMRELARGYGAGVVALAQATGDFPMILRNAMNKSLRAAYEETPATWGPWVRPATAPDFKTIRRIQLSGAPNLVARLEGMEVTYGVLTESEEIYALVEYTGGLRFTRRMLINDDLDAFDRAPRLQGSASKRLEDGVVYAIATANANMADGNALFSVAHANYVAVGAGAAPSIVTLNAARAAIRTQTGLAGETLNLVPTFLIGPAALEGTIKTLLNSEADPTATMGHAENIWKGQLTPVIEPRLDANSTTAWYLAASFGQVDTVELCRLAGEETPVLSQETEFDTEDLKLAVRHTCAAKAIDWRGLYCNEGA